MRNFETEFTDLEHTRLELPDVPVSFKAPNIEGPHPIDVHVAPKTISDKIAYGFVKVLRFIADKFFAKRYGHRAVVLETVAAVPGMVGGLLQHLSALRRIKDDEGWIKTLLDEAENERMHLMTFIEIAEPNKLERAVIMIVQMLFYNAYFFLYLFAPRTALSDILKKKRCLATRSI